MNSNEKESDKMTRKNEIKQYMFPKVDLSLLNTGSKSKTPAPVRKRKQKGWILWILCGHMIKTHVQSTVFLLGDVTTATPLQRLPKIIDQSLTSISIIWSKRMIEKSQPRKKNITWLPDQVCYSIDIGYTNFLILLLSFRSRWPSDDEFLGTTPVINLLGEDSSSEDQCTAGGGPYFTRVSRPRRSRNKSMKIVNIDLTVPRYPCIECDIEVPELATHLQSEHHYALEHAEFEFSKQSRLRVCKSEHRGKHVLLPCEVFYIEIFCVA